MNREGFKKNCVEKPNWTSMESVSDTLDARTLERLFEYLFDGSFLLKDPGESGLKWSTNVKRDGGAIIQKFNNSLMSHLAPSVHLNSLSRLSHCHILRVSENCDFLHCLILFHCPTKNSEKYRFAPLLHCTSLTLVNSPSRFASLFHPESIVKL